MLNNNLLLKILPLPQQFLYFTDSFSLLVFIFLENYATYMELCWLMLWFLVRSQHWNSKWSTNNIKSLLKSQVPTGNYQRSPPCISYSHGVTKVRQVPAADELWFALVIKQMQTCPYCLRARSHWDRTADCKTGRQTARLDRPSRCMTVQAQPVACL